MMLFYENFCPPWLTDKMDPGLRRLPLAPPPAPEALTRSGALRGTFVGQKTLNVKKHQSQFRRVGFKLSTMQIDFVTFPKTGEKKVLPPRECPGAAALRRLPYCIPFGHLHWTVQEETCRREATATAAQAATRRREASVFGRGQPLVAWEIKGQHKDKQKC